ncbi:hypothetical protein CKAN_00999400 [Cinnamomum micranthum f. kanehirae]|uniref:Uncharacterized protein n=1 Tax=Cinnamomum micranthum f. kanehirae TaxID=337451 RepID=A0A3S3MX99_9MAGN|nr:hypothetical protein CKAN_00999400 [Cinnamomum micranthum f. kanehirae]
MKVNNATWTDSLSRILDRSQLVAELDSSWAEIFEWTISQESPRLVFKARQVYEYEERKRGRKCTSATPPPPSTSSPTSGSALLLPPQPLPPHYSSISDDNLGVELFPEYTTPKRSLLSWMDIVSQALGDKRRQIAVSDSSPSQTVSGCHLSLPEQTCIPLGDGRGGRGAARWSLTPSLFSVEYSVL